MTGPMGFGSTTGVTAFISSGAVILPPPLIKPTLPHTPVLMPLGCAAAGVPRTVKETAKETAKETVKETVKETAKQSTINIRTCMKSPAV
jgi:hypothetical protein